MKKDENKLKELAVEESLLLQKKMEIDLRLQEIEIIKRSILNKESKTPYNEGPEFEL